jgi:hypothetical protein
MSTDYPDAAPSQGWPASHQRRLDALERSLPASVFAATLLGTSLPHYLPKELLDQVRDLAAQYPGPAAGLGLFVFLGVAKIPPPPESSPWFPVWKLWATLAPSRWDQWGGLKAPGRVEPELPPPTPRNTGDQP